MEFQWDAGNKTKNWEKHHVSCEEAEQCFLNPHVIISDLAHSQNEARYFLFGQTNEYKKLTIIFTVRHKKLIRIVSARPMQRKERKFYEKSQKNTLLQD